MKIHPPPSDHGLLALAFMIGAARWESSTRELAVGGIRYSCKLDFFGLPALNGLARKALQREIHRRDEALSALSGDP